ELLLVLTGCQAQAEGQALLKRFRYLDFVLGPDRVGELPQLVSSLEAKQVRSVDYTQRIKPHDFSFVNLSFQSGESLTTAFVTIMKGCDNFCSFCIVPYVRGREVSRPSTEILAEIQTLCRHGVKEVTLLGQNVNSYGTKSEGELSFTRLIRRIAEETPLKRLRFTTSHPKDVGPDLIAAFREVTILAKHLHLPVQSGSNEVLKRMYRTYTREEYLEIVARLREACPDIALTPDLIAGFPGERERDFQATLSLLDQVRFDSAYSFQYSPRPHTTAGRYFQDDVSSQEKENRLRCLQEKQATVSLSLNRECLGKTFEVLLEGPSKIGATLQGRTTHNRIMHLDLADESKIGEMLWAKATRATPTALVGEMLGNG